MFFVLNQSENLAIESDAVHCHTCIEVILRNISGEIILLRCRLYKQCCLHISVCVQSIVNALYVICFGRFCIYICGLDGNPQNYPYYSLCYRVCVLRSVMLSSMFSGLNDIIRQLFYDNFYMMTNI